ncbi:peptidase M61 [Gammaproteobacteria bacterium 45_16_T64]|nr:peptidase M61 [Gammaproteobacteria bacterium 45_16_T64]
MIQYTITSHDVCAHLFHVTCTIPTPKASGQRLTMPTWIPGSYMIRDFAKNIVEISAKDPASGHAITINKVDKTTWRLGDCAGAVVVSYDVYSWDMSVRAAHLDQTHGYFNGTSVFLAVEGQESLKCELDIQRPSSDHANTWRVATTLKESTAQRYGFGKYMAQDYDELIDHPVEMADYGMVSFTACGVPHEIVFTGKHYADMERIAEDLKVICEYQIRFFGEPAPMDRYIFFTWVVGDGYGGLEHRASTSLICSRADLPNKNDVDVTDGYRTFLGLCSHEYFHTWNVKRIKPAKFLPYDLTQESHTELLWAFEGITSYYDDLILARTGIITQESYLELLGQVMTRVYRASGRLKQTVSESSFDAWTKFYKQDENAPNAIVSYYTKGTLVVLGLDLLLRELTAGQVSMDHVMKMLWHEFGLQQVGVQERELEQRVISLAEPHIDAKGKEQLQSYFEQALRTTEDTPLPALLETQGVALHQRPADSVLDKGGKPSAKTSGAETAVSLGATFAEAAAGVKLAVVFQDSPAHRAGLSAGDVIIAVDHLRVSKANIEKSLSVFAPGDSVEIHAFRRDELMTFTLELASPVENTVYLTIEDSERATNWLMG